MCGIVGGFKLDGERLGRMMRCLQHRGPDGSGSFIHRDFAMGMTRLGITGIQDGGQPFSSLDRNIQVVFNGEIYNWRRLRKELEEYGHSFKTDCDGEILPAAWQAWREEMFPKLNGMFSIALYDVDEQVLILARDQCGQKPLYYSSSGGLFLFGSEIRAFLAGGISLSPCREQFASYLVNRYVSEPASLFQEIQILPAGHWAQIEASGQITSISRYWTPTEESSLAGASQCLEELDLLTRSSVQQSLQCSWKSVLYLSSGVDSSMLAQYIHDLGGVPSTLALGFNTAQDEVLSAEKFSHSLGFEHHNLVLGCEALECLPRVVAQMERPVGDALIIAFDALAKYSKALGAKVAYGAEGIDEHFGGYSFQQVYLKALKLRRLGRMAGGLFLEKLPSFFLDRFSQFPASLGEEGKQRVARYLRQFHTFSPEWQMDYLRFLYEPPMLSEVLTNPDQSYALSTGVNFSSGSREDSLLRRQYDSWLQDWSLIRQDKNTMAHSIEYRSPFLDPRLIKFAFSLPASSKITTRRDKYIWRQLAAQKLPSDIAWRPKVPFYLPLEDPQWRAKLIAMSHDILTTQALGLHGWIRYSEVKKLQKSTSFLPLKKLATLLIFQLWYEQYF